MKKMIFSVFIFCCVGFAAQAQSEMKKIVNENFVIRQSSRSMNDVPFYLRKPAAQVQSNAHGPSVTKEKKQTVAPTSIIFDRSKALLNGKGTKMPILTEQK